MTKWRLRGSRGHCRAGAGFGQAAAEASAYMHCRLQYEEEVDDGLGGSNRKAALTQVRRLHVLLLALPSSAQ